MRIVKIACVFLGFFYALAFLADFIAPYSPLEQNSSAGYASPSKIHFDFKKGFYVYSQNFFLDPITLKKSSKEITQNQGGSRYYIKFFTKGKLFQVDKPGYIYLFGTDRIGRDLFSRLIYGARPSLSIGFLGVLISFPLALIYGGIAGFAPRWIDNLMMRLAEAIMSLPSFYLLIILSAILPASLSNIERFALITVILSFISWAGLARIIRGQILSIKEKDFIASAQVIGQNHFMIILKHLLPHTTSLVIVSATLSVPSFIIGESALSFLGLGINQPDPSWGNILAEGKELSNILIRPLLLWVPAILIFITIFSFNVIGDYLRDKLDPKHISSDISN
jgi:peptide/nickel transport system permease protein